MIGVIDIGNSNIDSVSRSLNLLGAEHSVTDDLDTIRRCDGLVLPGVGNFTEASRTLAATGLKEVVRDRVLREKTPILGICLGMQLLLSFGEEGASEASPSEGLGLIDGTVRPIKRRTSAQLRIPHVGWNDVSHPGTKLFSGIDQGSDFYFVHSYEVVSIDPHAILSTTCYEVDIVAAVEKANIFGVQFHPEKSQRSGLRLLENFVASC